MQKVDNPIIFEFMMEADKGKMIKRGISGKCVTLGNHFDIMTTKILYPEEFSRRYYEHEKNNPYFAKHDYLSLQSLLNLIDDVEIKNEPEKLSDWSFILHLEGEGESISFVKRNKTMDTDLKYIMPTILFMKQLKEFMEKNFPKKVEGVK
jgi:hypothetical protein